MYHEIEWKKKNQNNGYDISIRDLVFLPLMYRTTRRIQYVRQVPLVTLLNTIDTRSPQVYLYYYSKILIRIRVEYFVTAITKWCERSLKVMEMRE